MKTIKNNIYLFYIIEFLGACIFTTAIWTFFFISYLTFSFSTALVLTVLSWFISFIFEVPSGVWADKYWRKRMYFLWIFLIILGFSIWIFSKNIYLFVFSSSLNWIWFALISWNLEALIHDSLELQKKENKFKDIQANWYIAIFSWRALSSLLAWYLFVINPLFPVYGTIIAYILIFLLLFFINDKWQQKSKNSSLKNHMFTWFKLLIQDKFIFYFVIIITLISSIWNIYWFTYQPYFKYIWISIENIWILFALTWFFSALWAHIIKKLQDKFNEKEIIFISLFLLLISAIWLQFFNIYWALFWLIIISIMFGFIMSFWNNVLIKKSPKTHKSTILSIFSLFITIWYVIFSVWAWYILDYIWIEKLYFWTIILIIFLIIFSLVKLKNNENKT